MALLRIPGVAAIHIAPGAEVQVDSVFPKTRLTLMQGEITARVQKRHPGESFTVMAGSEEVRVVGTVFSVSRTTGGNVAVSVREGTVVVAEDGAGGATTVVAQIPGGSRWEIGGTWTADRTGEPVVALLDETLQGHAAAELLPALRLASRDSTQEITRPPVAASSQAPQLMRAVRLPPVIPPAPAAVQSSPKSLAAPAAEPIMRGAPESQTRAVSVSPASAATPPLDTAPRRRRSASRSAPTGPSAMDPSSVVAPSRSVDSAAPAQVAPFAESPAREARGDLPAAAESLARAATEDRGHAELALVELGRLAQRRLNDPDRALAAFRQYRQEYPQGALLAEVDFSVLEIAMSRGDKAATLAETEHFLAAHPDSPRVVEIRMLRANQLRDLGHYEKALADYLALSDSTAADDAVYSAAYCELKLGDPARAAATLRSYLQRFPEGAHRSEARSALAGN
jgi:TolA-binding protein